MINIKFAGLSFHPPVVFHLSHEGVLYPIIISWHRNIIVAFKSGYLQIAEQLYGRSKTDSKINSHYGNFSIGSVDNKRC